MDYLEQHVEDMRIIAEYMHETGCYYNHTDGCGWYYDVGHGKNDVEYMWSLPSHEDYYDRAQKRCKNLSQYEIAYILLSIEDYNKYRDAANRAKNQCDTILSKKENK